MKYTLTFAFIFLADTFLPIRGEAHRFATKSCLHVFKLERRSEPSQILTWSFVFRPER